MQLKLFRATVANADIGCLKSFHTLFDKHSDHMLVKFEQNCIVQTTRNFELFDKNPSILKTIFDKALTPFWNAFLWLKQLFNAKLLISRLPSFSVQKLRSSITRVTRLKVAPNMADTISIKDSSLKPFRNSLFKRNTTLYFKKSVFFRWASVTNDERQTLLTIEKVFLFFICHTCKYCILFCACVACLVVCIDETSWYEIAVVTICSPIKFTYI